LEPTGKVPLHFRMPFMSASGMIWALVLSAAEGENSPVSSSEA
jgi:hypothetical protein